MSNLRRPIISFVISFVLLSLQFINLGMIPSIRIDSGKFAGPNAAFAVPAVPSGFELKQVLSGLSAPTDIVFASDGRWFIAEKDGIVRVVKNGQLLASPLLDIRGHVNTYTDRGLLSLALDPDFATNGYIYLLYTFHRSGTALTDPQTNRLTRVQLTPPSADVMSPAVNPAETILLGMISTPYDTGQFGVCKPGTDCMPVDGPTHAIGTVIFAPDKTLYVSIGEGASPDFVDKRALRSQDKNWLSGKVLHVDKSGKGLSTNPFWSGDPNAPISKVFQYGFRNPFRVTVHPQNGLYTADVGWNRWEEVDHAQPGANFGWPCYEGAMIRQDFASNPDTKSTCEKLYNAAGGTEHPQYAYPHPTPDTGAAIIGGTFYTGGSYPTEFSDNYFFGDLVIGFVKRIVFDGAGNFASVQDFATGLPMMSKVFSFRDNGDVGLLSINDGKIYRISFTPGNRAPVAVASANKIFGPLPLNIQFTGQNSFDPDPGDTVTYSWNFGDGSLTSTLQNPQHTFTTAGKKVVTLTVSDGQLSGSTQLEVFPGNSPPTISISKPPTNSVFYEGQTVNYAGTASDPQDGSLTATKVKWKLILHHNTHIHIAFDNVHGFSGSFTADAQGADTYYELEFSATDSEGLTSTKSIRFDVLPAVGYQYDPYLVLNGNNYADTASSLKLKLSTFSVGAWFMTSTDFTSTACIVNKGGSDSETTGKNQNYGIWMTGTEQIQAGFETTTGANNYVVSPLKYNDGNWHHAIATYGGTILRLYIDGKQVASLPTTAAPDNTGAQPVRVGANSLSPKEFFTGRIDEIRVWNRALVPSEVLDQYAEGQVNPGGQILHLQFGSQSDTTPPDTTIVSTFDGTGKYIPNLGTTASRTMVITFSGTDNVDLAGFEYHLDGTAPYNWAFTKSLSVTFTNAAAGTHLFQVRAVDTAGNKDPELFGAGFSWTVSQPAPLGYDYDPSFLLTGSNHFDVPSSIASNQELQLTRFTLEAWFKSTQDFTSNAYIANKGGSGSDLTGKNMNYGIWMTSSEHVAAGFETTSGIDNFVTSASSYNDGNWHLATVSYDGTMLRLYIDGKRVSSTAATATPDNTGIQPLRIGGNSLGTNGFFAGNADELRLWSRAVTATEISNHFNNGSFNVTGQVAYVPF